ncbi:uncharacterized protein BDR25DRAFT_357757 [Lindgomyces ingoldianus]|uniref:Uncharacterized protein n=1 Tax=Lindgomyces ingoldianus TaxID=673940 RepID=A0ACB6QN43_9PLEO|nr:uncharacterized protein BDR25DRAFT_357757 [Lindgomyces ingoldianus]KAF2468403.1 hypothetical protein BDR25DRAFT_357757 [Lindgomyces ingoldianus]
MLKRIIVRSCAATIITTFAIMDLASEIFPIRPSSHSLTSGTRTTVTNRTGPKPAISRPRGEKGNFYIIAGLEPLRNDIPNLRQEDLGRSTRNVIRSALQEPAVTAENAHNMNEAGVMIGMLGVDLLPLATVMGLEHTQSHLITEHQPV